MRVVHLVPSVGPLSGGLGAVTLETSRAQRNAGIEASIWCADRSEDAAAADPAWPVLPLPVIGPRRFAYSPSGERRARTAPADLVHQHGLWTAQSRITEVFRKRGIPSVVAPHGMLAPYARRRSRWKKGAALAFFELRNLRRASCLHATADEEVRSIRQFGLRAPVAVVPNAVAPTWLSAGGDRTRFRRQHGLDDATRVMLFLSRIHPIKGLPMLLDALDRHRDALKGWRLLIAGPDEIGHRAAIERLAVRLGVAESVSFVGALFDETKRDAFAAADLFVLPTHTENFGIVIAEALACGVPVITTQGAPWRELETHGCGWWVPADTASLGVALIDAARRPSDELRAMGARGRELVASRYVWPMVSERTIALYRWLLGQAPRPEFVVVD